MFVAVVSSVVKDMMLNDENFNLRFCLKTLKTYSASHFAFMFTDYVFVDTGWIGTIFR